MLTAGPEEAINGEALVEMQHQDLKDMGMNSVGHRLTLLKAVYDIKVKQNVPLDPDHYVPICKSRKQIGRDTLADKDSCRRKRQRSFCHTGRHCTCD